MKEARRLFGIPDFRYYTVADGLKTLLEGFRSPFIEKYIPEPKHPQISLFSP